MMRDLDFDRLDQYSEEELRAAYAYYSEETERNDLYQGAMKVLINALYGNMGNIYFRYYDVNMADAITATGRCMIQYISDRLESFLSKRVSNGTERLRDFVIYNDTDSVYAQFNDFVKTVTKGKEYSNNTIANVLDAFVGKEVVPMMKTEYEAIAEHTNAMENKMSMKREVIAVSGVWRAKKNYIMYVLDDENIRYAEPQLKMMGVEVAKGGFPELIKEGLINSYKFILSDNEAGLIDYLADYRKKFFSSQYTDFVFSIGVSNVNGIIDDTGAFKSGAPYNSKAAATFNKAIEDYGLAYVKPIVNGDKIKIVRLKPFNVFGNSMIAYTDFMPKEFEIEQWVDYDSTYEKLFVNPLRSFTDKVGMQIEKRNSIDDLF